MKFIQLTDMYHKKVFVNAEAINLIQKSFSANTEIYVGAQPYPIIVIESPDKIVEDLQKQ